MKTSIKILSKGILYAAIMLFGLSASAETITEQFEAGSRSDLAKKNWQFWGFNVDARSPVEGNKSAVSGDLGPNSTNILSTPFYTMDGSGKMTFSHKVETNNNKKNGKNIKLTVKLVDVNGVQTSIFTNNYTTQQFKTKYSKTIFLPTKGIFRIYFDFTSDESSQVNGFIDEVTCTGATVTPVNQNGVPVSNDKDGDGVIDNEDNFPDDATKAFIDYFPQYGVYGTLAFEDLWPAQGDYDFNDMVVAYTFASIKNAQNVIVEQNYKFVIRAVGASIHSGFGFQLTGLDANKISAATGSKIEDFNTFKISSKGLELNQNYPTIIVVDDAIRLLKWEEGGYTFNTDPNQARTNTDTITINVKFNGLTVAESSNLNNLFNPFIVKLHGTNGTQLFGRGHEIHLPDYKPTALVDATLFGTANDKSNPAIGRYYKTENNLPFALNILQSFVYPVEKAEISKGYKNFINWAISGGTQYLDWFLDTPENTDGSVLYTK